MAARDFDNFYITFLSQGINFTGAGNIYLDVLPTDDEGWIVINPSSTNKKEIIYYRAKGLNYVTVTNSADRGVGGTTAQPHSQGAEVRMNVVSEMFEELSAAVQPILKGVVTDAGGLNIAISAWDGEIGGIQVVYAGTISSAVGDNQTTYLELDNTGTLFSNTVGFTTGRKRLAIVVTAGGDIVSITDKRQFQPYEGPFVNSVIAGQGIAVSSATGNVTISIPNGGINLATMVSGILPTANGGTGQSSYTLGDLLAGNGSGLTKLTVGSNNQFLIADSSQPTGLRWAAGVNSLMAGSGINVSGATGNVTVSIAAGGVDLATMVSGILPETNGGTGESVYAKGDLLSGDGTGLGKLGVGSNGQFIMADSSEALGMKWVSVTPGAVQVLDEGIVLTPTVTSFDFVGGGVTATVIGNAVTVTIPGGSSGTQVGIQFQDEGINLGASGTVDQVDFVGSGVIATRVGNKVTATISGGSGTVTSVSVTTANGVSGVVANPTTTPAITLTLGAITPTTVNGNTITTGTGTLTLGAGSTLATSATNSIILTSVGATNVTLPTSGTLYGTASNSITSAQLASSLTDETGTGVVVFSNSPTLVTPTLGVASATSLSLSTALTVPNGGTGTTTFTDGGVLIGNGSGIIQATSAGTAGQVLTSNGAGVDPTFQSVPGTSSTAGADSFTPVSIASTKVIAHGLGRVPKTMILQWGVAGAVNNLSSAGFGTVLVDSSINNAAISRIRSGAGNCAWGTGFSVKNDNVNDVIDWTGSVTFDATNITISVASFNSSTGIFFNWLVM